MVGATSLSVFSGAHGGGTGTASGSATGSEPEQWHCQSGRRLHWQNPYRSAVRLRRRHWQPVPVVQKPKIQVLRHSQAATNFER